MAEKKKEFQYGSAFLPSGEKKYQVIRWGWNGLNRTDDIDTGQLTDMSGAVCDPPYVMPMRKAKLWIDFASGIPTYLDPDTDSKWVSDARRIEGTPISIFGFDKQLLMAWEFFEPTFEKYFIVVDKFRLARSDTMFSSHRCGIHENSSADTQRSVVQFNVVTDPSPNPDGSLSGNIVNYTYDRKFLLYPDCYSLPYEFVGSFTSATLFNTVDNPIPVSELAAVYGSRVFGATENAVFSSAYNSYVDYSLDTADDVSSAHAWWSMAQSNTEANGAVTAIVSYDNHVVIFRKDFMQLVYNNKNPFRIVDVGAYGCDSNKSWTILNGVLYFASQEKVYAFTGGTPKDISKKMEFGDLSGAILGSYRDTVWMQTKDSIYIYKDGTWSDIGLASFGNSNYKVVQFATLDYALVALVDKTPTAVGDHTYALMFMDWDVSAMEPAPSDPTEWEPEYVNSWYIETDLMMLGKLDVRRVKKMSLMCEGHKNAHVHVYLMPDNDTFAFDDDHLVGKLEFDKNEKKMLRVLTRQFSGTRHRLRIYGSGYVKIYAAELKIAWGGDVYVEG